jgi:hypothetical protein
MKSMNGMAESSLPSCENAVSWELEESMDAKPTTS